MSSQRVRIQVWCEDRAQEQFVRALLCRKYGVDSRNLEFRVAPRGRGAASQWVIAQYGNAARTAKAKAHQANLGFLIVVDGDDQGLALRKQALFGSADPRGPETRLAVWVPTWSIETWVKYLASADTSVVTEDLSYKHEVGREWKELLAKAISASLQGGVEAAGLPSLVDARAELTRLPLS